MVSAFAGDDCVTHHPLTVAFPFPVILAEAATTPFSWTQALLVYGPLGLWVAWFVIRDKLDREERKQERADMERRHQENLDASKRMADAVRTNTDLLIVGFGAMKNIDQGYSDLLEKFRSQHPTGGS